MTIGTFETSNENFVLFGVPGSPYVRSAAVGLEEKGARFIIVALRPFEAKSPGYLKRHAFGRVPLLSHGKFELYETQAILRYLDRIIPEPCFTPHDPRAEARMNQLCGITDCYVMPHISIGISFDRLVAPRLGLPVDESKIKSFVPRAHTCLAEISRLLQEQDFLAGDSISIADLLLAPHLAFFAQAPEGGEILNRYPALEAWLDRMSSRPSFMRTTPEKLAAIARPSAA